MEQHLLWPNIESVDWYFRAYGQIEFTCKFYRYLKVDATRSKLQYQNMTWTVFDSLMLINPYENIFK